MTTDVSTTPRRRPVTRLGAGAAAVTLVGVALLSACGTGSSATTTTAAGTTAAAGASTSETAFDQCMTKNGVTRPSGAPGAGTDGGSPPTGTPPAGTPPTGGAGTPGSGTGQAPPGVDAATWQKALTACRGEAGAPPQGTDGG